METKTRYDTISLLNDITDILHAADDIMTAPRYDLCIEEKNPHDYVTEADKSVQAFLIKELGQKYPDAGFIAEEQDNAEFKRLVNDGCFIIDPIDGTLNYMTTSPLCCISAAYVEGGKAQCGVVYNPYMHETFYAVAGKGAYLNGEQIHCIERDLKYNTLLCEYTWKGDFHKVKDHMMAFRVIGSAALALCWLAAGRTGAYVSSGVKSWDVAAAGLIAEEAGLAVFDQHGNDFGIRESGTLMSCCKKDVPAILAMIDDCMGKSVKYDRGDWI